MTPLHPLDALGILIAFDVNIWALHYFGIVCFNDRPGYFPQLEVHR